MKINSISLDNGLLLLVLDVYFVFSLGSLCFDFQLWKIRAQLFFPIFSSLLFSSGGNLTSLFVQFSWVHVSNSTQTFAYYLCHLSRPLAHQVFYWFNIYEKVSFRIISPITYSLGGLPPVHANHSSWISPPPHHHDDSFITFLYLVFHSSIHFFIYSYLLTVCNLLGIVAGAGYIPKGGKKEIKVIALIGLIVMGKGEHPPIIFSTSTLIPNNKYKKK